MLTKEFKDGPEDVESFKMEGGNNIITHVIIARITKHLRSLNIYTNFKKLYSVIVLTSPAAKSTNQPTILLILMIIVP